MRMFHGSTVIVEKPDIRHSFRNLDFGKGFYLTSVEEQAERWARRKCDLLEQDTAVVSVYQMKEDMGDLSVKTFSDDLDEWIDFVCDCRNGNTEYQKFDAIFGKVANDKVYRVVNMYQRGIWDKERALREMRVYPSYDQMAFISQKAIERLLIFERYYEV